jgi:small-conductance mechanosensitive channel
MTTVQKIASAGLLALLAATAYGLWSTSQPTQVLIPQGKKAQLASPGATAADGVPTIDENAFLIAQRLAQRANTPEERELAEQAEKLADHELDIALAAALQQIEAHPPVLSPEAQKLQDDLQKSQKLLDADQAKVTQLTAALATATGSQQAALQDQLNLAQSQVELDKDEVEEANDDLLQAGGNVHQRIQKMMQSHEASHNRAVSTTAAPDPLANLHGLVLEVRQWMALRKKEHWITVAGERATATSAQLRTEREQLAAKLESTKASIPELAHHAKHAKTDAAQPGTAVLPSAPAAAAPTQQASAAQTATANSPTLLTLTRQIVADEKLLTLLDERITDRRELADTYKQWANIVASDAKSALHSVLSSALIILITLLVLVSVGGWLDTLFARTRLDRRQVGTLRTVTRVGLQVLGVLIILLVLIGVPGQIGTMLGLAGAGLTVALKDFIVAFIGWLALMGKNGIRLGDWVEINGVSGEVVELGMFHTVLLETGNWTDAGHPTGRRVTFTNSFAIQGHYFNFSTSGQWLWDELLVLVPYDRDPHMIADAIQKEVVAATADSARQAEVEWRRAVHARHDTGFSATPGIIVRPTVGGVEVAIRYITRASDRFALRARLYQSAVQLLAQSPRPLPTSAVQSA